MPGGWGGWVSLASGLGATSRLGSDGADTAGWSGPGGRILTGSWSSLEAVSCPGGRGPGCLLLPSLRPSRDPQSLCPGFLGLKAEWWPRGRELKQGSLVPVSLAEARVAAVVAPP